MAYQSLLLFLPLLLLLLLLILLIVKHTNKMPKQAHQECFSVNMNLMDMQRSH